MLAGIFCFHYSVTIAGGKAHYLFHRGDHYEKTATKKSNSSPYRQVRNGNDEVKDTLTANDEGSDRQLFRYEHGIPILDSRLSEIERKQTEAEGRENEYKQEQLKINRRLMWFNGGLFLVAIIGGIISVEQACIANKNAGAAIANANAAKDMVKQMQQSGTDTHELAVEAKNQVGKLTDSVKEAHSLAVAAQTANRNAVEADRPWMGAALNIQDFDVGKTPTFTIIFTNSGKRPAKVELTENYARVYETFPRNPQYLFDTVPSTSILVPGQATISSWKGHELSQVQVDTLKLGTPVFYVYTAIKYSDVTGPAIHWTHACWRYLPTMTFINNGFVNCKKYNDAQ
jgi:hypothetical protein